MKLMVRVLTEKDIKRGVSILDNQNQLALENWTE